MAGTPPSFELTNRLLRGWDHMQSSERPMFAVREPSGSLTCWQRVSTTSDTIHMPYPLPLAGVALTLTPNGPDLIGSVTAFTDAIKQDVPSEVTRTVYAHRAACSSDSGRAGRSEHGKREADYVDPATFARSLVVRRGSRHSTATATFFSPHDVGRALRARRDAAARGGSSTPRDGSRGRWRIGDSGERAQGAPDSVVARSHDLDACGVGG
jgi:hypothetical protein